MFYRYITGIHLSIANLFVLGFFLEMISCEYVKTKNGERNTEMIRLQNVEFWLVQHKRMELSNPGTFQAQAMSLTFKDQNNGNKMDRHTQEATRYPVLCPDRSAADLVQNILSLSGENLYTPTCSVMK